MRIVNLCSGSEGNSTYIEINDEKLLFDIGKNSKYINSKLEEIGIKQTDITGIIISHTHDDHINALKVFLNKNNPKIYLTEKMYYDIDYLKEYENILIYEDDFHIGNIHIDTIKTSHDASDARGFIIKYKDTKVVYLTDTGYLNRKYFEKLSDATYYLFESNHDITMLMDGPYPKWLKQRVVGLDGHLSNKDSSFYLTKLVGENTKKIVLMHLSKTNNTPKIAAKTLEDTFLEYELNLPEYTVAKQNEITEVCND